MIDGGSFEGRIEVGVSPRVLNCVISERLVRTCSIEHAFPSRQGVYKVLNFSNAILRKSFDFLDEFLLLTCASRFIVGYNRANTIGAMIGLTIQPRLVYVRRYAESKCC
jgi:hypothetical protein